MYALIAIVIIIAAVVALFLIVALFVKKEYSIERQIMINKPKAEVFRYIKYLKNQDHYNKWVIADPTMKKDFKGMDGTPGFIYAWDSQNKNVGKGEQEIKTIKEGDRIDIEVRFEKPFEGIGYAPIITDSHSETQTNVRWGMSGKSKYPLNFTNLFMDKILGKDLEISLTNLKTILEK